MRIQLDAIALSLYTRLYPEQIEALVGRNIHYSSLGGDRREMI
ncbi:MAG: hypothetical protein ACOVQ7_04770 [Limnoraphis robusta]